MNGPGEVVRFHLGGNVITVLRAKGFVVRWAADSTEYIPLGTIGFGLLGFADVPLTEVVDDPDAVRVEYADGTVETLRDHTEDEDEP